MQKINFQNLPSTATPLNATNMNAIQTNVENVFNGSVPAGNMVVDSIRSKNMFNKNTAIRGKLVSRVAGTIDDNSNYYASDFIAIEENTTFTLTNCNSYYTACYNASKTYIGYMPNADTMTTIEGTKYVRLTIPVANIDTAQMELGNEATAYTPYQELNNLRGSYYYNGYLNSTQTIGHSLTAIDNLTNKSIKTYGNPLLITLTLPIRITATGTGTIRVYIDDVEVNNRIITAANNEWHNYTGQVIINGISAGNHTITIKGWSDNSAYNMEILQTRLICLSVIEL